MEVDERPEVVDAAGIETLSLVFGECCRVYALTDATVHTATERGMVDGGVLVEDGEISAVGDIDVPDTADVLDLAGAHLTPGLVDAHSHAGMAEWGEPEDGDVNELTDPVTPHVSALDGFHPHDEELAHAVRNGVTTVSARVADPREEWER